MKEEKDIELTKEQLGGVAGGVGTDERIYQIVADNLDLSLSQVTGGSSLTGDLGADEYDLLDIIHKIEVAFSIRIPESDYHRLRTVNDLVEYVKMCIR